MLGIAFLLQRIICLLRFSLASIISICTFFIFLWLIWLVASCWACLCLCSCSPFILSGICCFF
ncbi:hypothetical protein D3C76_677860 [compost metagenome]